MIPGFKRLDGVVGLTKYDLSGFRGFQMKKLIIAVVILAGLGIYAGVSLTGSVPPQAVAGDKP